MRHTVLRAAVLAVCVTALTLACGGAPRASSRVVWVKYRSANPVDVSHPRFEYLDTSRSSLVTGAWYDASNEYMIIGLRGVYYHYCRMPQPAWSAFRGAKSFGRHYRARIKGNFDCRLGGVPDY
jgi:hypothetical protein